MVFHCLRYLPLVSIDDPSVSNGSLYNAEYLNSRIKEELKYASYFAGMVRRKKKSIVCTTAIQQCLSFNNELEAGVWFLLIITHLMYFCSDSQLLSIQYHDSIFRVTR